MARGGATTATTYIRPYKQTAGLSTVQTMEERFAYGLNPQKLGPCPPTSATRPQPPDLLKQLSALVEL